VDHDAYACGFLWFAGLAPTAEKRLFFVALARSREPGGRHNPWGLREHAPGSPLVDSTGIRHYRSAEAAWSAVWAVLHNGQHDRTLEELETEGTSAVQLARVWDLTPAPRLVAVIEAMRAAA